MKAKVHVSFFCSPSRRAPRVSSPFRKGGEDKVKACLHLFLHRNDLILNSFSGGVKGEGKKRKLADVRVHACVREESWGGASQTRHVFFDSPRVSSRTSGDLDSIVGKRVQAYCFLKLSGIFANNMTSHASRRPAHPGRSSSIYT